MIKRAALACLVALAGFCGPTLSAQRRGAAQERLPVGEAVLDKYVEATGGAEAWGKIKTFAARGTFTMTVQGQPLRGNAIVYGREPNLQYMEIRIDGAGTSIQASDGKNAWEIDLDGKVAIKSGKELEIALESNYVNDAKWRDRYISVQTKGTKRVEGEECYEVIATTRAGKTSTSYYSKKTGLKVKEDSQVFKDYKDIGGVLIPFVQITEEEGLKISIKHREIKINVNIPPGTFDPPQQVQEMLGGRNRPSNAQRRR